MPSSIVSEIIQINKTSEFFRRFIIFYKQCYYKTYFLQLTVDDN